MERSKEVNWQDIGGVHVHVQSGERYPYLDEIRSFLHEQGCSVEEIKVGYEFQKGAKSMLNITI